MAENDPILGGAKVRITVDNEGLKKGVDEAESTVGRLGQTVSKVQAVVSKLLIPAALASSVGALVNRFRQAQKEMEELQRRFDDAASAAERITANMARADASELQRELLQLQERAEAQQKAINDALETELDKRQNLFGQVARFLVTRKSVSDLDAQAADANERITGQLRQQAEILRDQINTRRLETTQKEIDKIRRETLDDEAQLTFDMEQRRSDLRKRLGEATTEEERAAITELWKLYEQLGEQAQKKLHEQRIKQLKEQNQEMIRGFEAFLDVFRRQSSAGFQSDRVLAILSSMENSLVNRGRASAMRYHIGSPWRNGPWGG